MKNRYLFTFTLFLTSGIVLGTNTYFHQYIQGIFPYIVCFVLIIAGILFKKALISVASAAVIIGMLSGSIANSSESKALYRYSDTEVSGRLIITELTHKSGYSYGVAEILCIDGEKINESITIFIDGDKKFRVNDVLEFKNLKISSTGNPGKALNEGAFDYVMYNRSQGIFFKGNLDSEDGAAVSDFSLSPSKLARAAKLKISERISDVLSHPDHAGIITGLFVGDKTLISDEVYSAFKLAGISHILCVSGMHVIIIMSAILSVLALCGISPGKRRIFSAAAVLVFVFITGMSASSMRAGLMVLSATLAAVGNRDYDSPTSLAAAVVLILFLNPLTVYDPSFQLSASATLGIITLQQTIKQQLRLLPSAVAEGIALTVSAQLGSLPIMIMSFGYVSVASVIANIAITTFLPIIYIFAIVTVICGYYPFVLILGYVLDLIILIAGALSKIPFGIIDLPTFPTIIAGFSVISVTLILGGLSHYERKRGILISILAGFAIIITGCVIEKLPDNMLTAHFMNVGQGDCCLLKLPDGKHIMVDTGTEKECRNEVIPYLNRKGIKELDALILSHSHSDHAGGAELLSGQININKIVYPYNESHKHNMLDAPVHMPVCDGDVLSYGKCIITILGPDKSLKTDNANKYSLIFRLDYGESSYLFTGDADFATILDAESIDADVLKVPHHGSEYGLSAEVISDISPEISVISVGESNSYGHPDSLVLELLSDYNSRLYRTDRDGMISIKCDEKGNFTK